MKLVIIVNVDISYFSFFNIHAKNMRLIAGSALHIALYSQYNFNLASQRKPYIPSEIYSSQ